MGVCKSKVALSRAQFDELSRGSDPTLESISSYFHLTKCPCMRVRIRCRTFKRQIRILETEVRELKLCIRLVRKYYYCVPASQNVVKNLSKKIQARCVEIRSLCFAYVNERII